MTRQRLARLALRVAVGAGVLFFVVNFLTGPGAPEVDRGLPFLRDHGTLVPMICPVFWLNLALLGLAFASAGGAFWLRARAARSPAPPPPAPVLAEGRFLDGRFGGRGDLKAVRAVLGEDVLELSTSRVFTLIPARARIPLRRLATVRFVREWGTWKIRGDAPGDPQVAFTLTPRRPRGWHAAFRRAGVPIRPVGLAAGQRESHRSPRRPVDRWLSRTSYAYTACCSPFR